MEPREPGMWEVHRSVMDDISAGGHRRVDTSRPTLGFPVGTAFIILLVFGFSAVFSCCYHWEKIKTLYNWHTGLGFTDSSIPSVQANLPVQVDGDEGSSHNNLGTPQRGSLAVVMPGDKIPKFIAWRSPHGSGTSPQVNEPRNAAASVSR